MKMSEFYDPELEFRMSGMRRSRLEDKKKVIKVKYRKGLNITKI